ncbi:hypothetical protein IDH50_00715 [Aeromicrobium tamlense]|uniref:Uncharacterized protein n=1 Tax=Aeromicrobium tamlense TaxID=375541 RepID=A0A8I0KGV6_9ACTN|nr:hypothetical protein [Aeromicrobium tamlense]MBD1268745.1 hypothetical protein [Aeromicrobium tamlense]NYI37349.1 hypothetical protein [Aeromicrobium tamlense]
MSEVSVRPDGAIEVVDGDQVLVYTPYAVTAPDGTTVAHESRGGSMASVWAGAVGEAFVEVSHLGHGPEGGELVMVVTRPGHAPEVALGALVTDEIPAEVPKTWPAAVDLAIGLIAGDTLDSGTKDDVEDFHQRLLGAWFGHG